MTHEDRENLAMAYAMAWRTVKGERCDVIVEKNGWFTRKLYSGFSSCHANSMRAGEVIRGLMILNTRINDGDVHHSFINKRAA
jgi:hypothetical protein